MQRRTVRFSPREFDDVVQEAIDSLPETIRRAIANVLITVEDRPDPDLGEDPHLLGLFVGTPRGQRSFFDSSGPPDRIYLFQRNIEKGTRTRKETVAEIRTTLLHEVGHYLGFDEAQLDDLGLA